MSLTAVASLALGFAWFSRWWAPIYQPAMYGDLPDVQGTEGGPAPLRNATPGTSPTGPVTPVGGPGRADTNGWSSPGRRARPPNAVIARSFALYVLVAFATSWAFGWTLGLWRVAAPHVAGRPATLSDALAIGGLLWLGFLVPPATNKMAWQFRSGTVGLIDVGYELVRAAGMVLAFWYLG